MNFGNIKDFFSGHPAADSSRIPGTPATFGNIKSLFAGHQPMGSSGAANNAAIGILPTVTTAGVAIGTYGSTAQPNYQQGLVGQGPAQPYPYIRPPWQQDHRWQAFVKEEKELSETVEAILKLIDCEVKVGYSPHGNVARLGSRPADQTLVWAIWHPQLQIFVQWLSTAEMRTEAFWQQKAADMADYIRSEKAYVEKHPMPVVTVVPASNYQQAQLYGQRNAYAAGQNQMGQAHGIAAASAGQILAGP